MGNARRAAQGMRDGVSRAVAWPWVARRLQPDGLATFLYHDVTDLPSRFSDANGLNVRPERFEAQLRFMKRYFDVISMDDVLSGASLPRRAALITFDDGLASVFDTAQQILAGEKVSATVFLNMSVIHGEACWAVRASYLIREDRNFHELWRRRVGRKLVPADLPSIPPELVGSFLEIRPELEARIAKFEPRYVDAKTMREAEALGVLMVGSHLYRHHNATKLRASDLSALLDQNATYLAEFTNSRPVFSYPFGEFSDETNRMVRESGVKLLFASGGQVNTRAGTVLQRIVARGPAERLVSDAIVDHHLRPVLEWVRAHGGML